MPPRRPTTLRQHIAKAQENERLSQSLEQGPHYDWAVTVLFYAALHWVDAHLSAVGIHPKDHRDRKKYIKRRSNLAAIRGHYFYLKERSEDARYDCVAFSRVKVQDMRQKKFEPLKQHMRTLLRLPDETR